MVYDGFNSMSEQSRFDIFMKTVNANYYVNSNCDRSYGNKKVHAIVVCEDKINRLMDEVNLSSSRYQYIKVLEPLAEDNNKLKKFLLDNPEYRKQYNEMMVMFKLAGLENNG